ncbi:DUF4303 domain-containing protein [Streptomyces sp. DSM 44915]|uniref:DUF4303 domain-containing protein n=1 Tax=Streptomyces chisholmiae TaxID=3075540 RepID=A0ABU2JPQ7_9ACTN|nr:DUF4303 domain-containing protein [Streptomyces sp. DSM 44915]MDT0266960.1 DUF4303 domain-containing protein [Streptomyces sp. DSM 44915]
MSFDWVGLKSEITRQVVDFVRATRAAHPDERLYAAALHAFYAETGGQILSPLVGVASEEWLAQAARTPADAADLRWSAADWPRQLDPTATGTAWVAPVAAHACAAHGAHWDEVHDRYLHHTSRACVRARAALVTAGDVPADFLVIPLDEEFALLPTTLTPTELAHHFPFLLDA